MSNGRWPSVPLGDVLRHRKEFVQIDDLQTYRRCRVQLHAEGIVLRDTVPGMDIKTKRQQVCRAGDLLVAEIDAKVGGFGIVPSELDGAVVSSHYFLYDIDEEKLIRRYLDYYVRTPMFREQVAAQGSTNYAAIRPAHVLGYTIPLPSLDEQRRIVGRIEEVAERIEEARKLRQAATEEGFLLWSAGVRSLLSNSGGSRSVPLRELVTVRGGGTPSRADPSLWSGHIPWVTPKDMKVREIYDAIDHISEDATRTSPAKLIGPEAVLVVVRGMILAHTVPTAILRKPAAINQDMKALICSDRITPAYLITVMWAWNRQLLDLVARSSHDTRKLETDKLLGFRVPLPSLVEQKGIVQRAAELGAQTGQLLITIANSESELAALLPGMLKSDFDGQPFVG